MGHWDRQHGEIILPSAEFAAVRQAVQKATHEYQSKVFDETQAFWKGLTRKEQTDPAAYTAALQRYVDAKHKQLYPPQSYSSWSRPAPAPFTEEFVDDVEWRLGLPPDGKPARVLKSDLPFPTNRTTSFPAGEGSVSFDKDISTVRWSTSENRGATERAHNSAAGKAFFDRLKTVKWTRNTGGIIMGNDEYAEEAGRGDECSTAYGPFGAAPGTVQLPGVHGLERQPGYPGGSDEAAAGAVGRPAEAAEPDGEGHRGRRQGRRAREDDGSVQPWQLRVLRPLGTELSAITRGGRGWGCVRTHNGA